MRRWNGGIHIDSGQPTKEKVEGLLQQIYPQICKSEECRYKVKLVLSELIQNALIHGETPIDVKAILCDQCLCFLVMDQGNGVKLSRKTDQEILSESGRGIKIITSLSERVSFNKNASKVYVKLSV